MVRDLIEDCSQSAPPERPSMLKPIRTIVIAEQFGKDELFTGAISLLLKSLKERTGYRPVVTTRKIPPQGSAIVLGKISHRRSGDATSGKSEFFSVRSSREGSRHIITLSGESPRSTLYGIYWLADEIYGGIGEKLFSLNRTVRPAFQYRLVDSGAVGIMPDRTDWGNDYSHHSRAFQDALLPRPPYIDEVAFRRIRNEFREYLHRMISYGFNGIIIDGFLEFICFDHLGDGRKVYDHRSEYRSRNLVLGEKFGELFSYARDRGMKVVLKTDMVALTQPLERYFLRKFGSIDVTSEAFWRVYRIGLDELFTKFPSLEGIMIRIGEAGSVYNPERGHYYSKLLVTTDDALQTMIKQLLPAAEKHDRRLFFRTWSVGVGEIGDMHVNPDTYRRVLRDIGSNHLVVSTKYGQGDFYSYIPFNPTFEAGAQNRLIEFQARREFEGFMAFPNYVGPLHQSALQYLAKKNDRIDGIWLWTQNGGPLRTGPLLLYPFHGFWQLTDINVYATGRLSWNPGDDLNRITDTWIGKNWSSDPQVVGRIRRLMYLSREAVLKGLYIGELSRKRIEVIGLDPPTTIWFWDIVSGSNSVLSVAYLLCRDRIEEMIAEGFEATAKVRQMKELASGIDMGKLRDRALHVKLLQSLDYEENLFETLAWYRKSFLRFYQWLDRGDRDAYREWEEAGARFHVVKKEHLGKYGKNLDFPAYNFFAADIGMTLLQRNEGMKWVARVIFAVTLALILTGLSGLLPGDRGSGLRVIAMTLIQPWKSVGMPDTVSVRLYALLPTALILFTVLAFTSFNSFYFTSLILLSLIMFTVSLLIIPRTGSPLSLRIAAYTAPLLLPVIIMTGFLSIGGPQYFWYRSWTNSIFSTVFLSLLLFSLLYIFFAEYAIIRSLHSLRAPAAAGALLIASGIPIILCGLTLIIFGSDTVLDTINRELAILPLSLSIVLGMTKQLNIHPHFPLFLSITGMTAATVGIVMRKGYAPPL